MRNVLTIVSSTVGEYRIFAAVADTADRSLRDEEVRPCWRDLTEAM